MNYPKSWYSFKGTRATTTWIRDSGIEKYSPATQVYAVVFNNKNEILIARKTKDSKWQIPGGKPENSESYKQTVARELLEEVDVQVSKIYPLGAQKVEIPGNPNKNEGKFFYQLRCVAELSKLLPQTPDPDGGNIWKRKFIPAEKITEYVKWGKVGNVMFKDAINLWKENNSSS